jgi:hypothetical protein
MRAENSARALAGQSGDPRPRMQLLEWQAIGKGSLIGRARVRLPNQLEIADIAVFEKDGRRWAHSRPR